MERIPVSLPIQAWNLILIALSARPYSEVSDLIVEIKRQAEEGINALSTEAFAPVIDGE